MVTGGCRCGAIRYEAKGEAAHHAFCHCTDCQKASGSPMVAWIAFKTGDFRITQGEPNSYTADSGSTRQFCRTCGTPLFFFNEAMLPGIVDIPTVTLDDPDAQAPQAHIQVAERRKWMEGPEFERWPS